MVSSRKKIPVWWRRAGLLSRLVVFLLCSVALGYLVYLQKPSEGLSYEDSNILVFFLVNLNVAILCVLIFLVGRNIVKLVFDRRRGLLGSKLRLKLLLAFVGITLVPTSILFFHSSGLLTRAMEGWFSGQVETTVESAVEIARLYYETIEADLAERTEQLRLELQGRQLVLSDKELLAEFFADFRKEKEIYSIEIVNFDGKSFLKETSPVADLDLFQAPDPQRAQVERALAGKASTLFEERASSQFVRRYASMSWSGDIYALIVTQRVRPEVVELFAQVKDSFREYEQLKVLKGQIKSGFLLTLGMITGLILFAAIWFAFYLSRELTIPVRQLAGGIERISGGDYEFQLRAGGDDELGTLVSGFNRMTRDLKKSREMIETRKNFVEGVISKLNVGVFVLSHNGFVSLLNDAAQEFLELESKMSAIGRPFQELVPSSIANVLIQAGYSISSKRATLERHLDVERAGKRRKIFVAVTSLQVPGESQLGYLVVIDDVTELAEAEKMAVWRDAAKRIAHEIKNPLTPIKLSAQRIRRLSEGELDVGKVEDALATILLNVGSIKRLADEFSNFARLPEPQLEDVDLHSLIKNATQPFEKSHSRTKFIFEFDSRLERVEVDPEQFQRLFINLIDNALAAMKAANISSPEISVRTSVASDIEQVRIEIADNGPGVPDELKAKVFDPYFTTKEDGTGLGLAIVHSIVADHQGSISLLDGDPLGSRIVIKLPLRQNGAAAVEKASA